MNIVSSCAFVSLFLAVLSQQTTVIFRTTVEHVRLDVVVTDKNGRPVGNLSKEDFEVVDRGKEQAIESAELVTIPIVYRDGLQFDKRIPSVDVVSNAHSRDARQWVVVVDDLHIIEQHIIATKAVITEFLKLIPADDQVAMVFVGRSDLSQDFTSDTSALLRTVDRIKDALGFAYDASDTPQVGGHPDMVARMSSIERARYAHSTIDVLTNVARALTKSSYSRKAIVYLSEGMTYGLDSAFSKGGMDLELEPIRTREFFDELQSFFDVARRSGIPVYPVDPRGLPDGSFTRHNTSNGRYQNQWANHFAIAEGTGGQSFVGFEDVPKAMRTLVEDNSTFYLIGYYPDPFEKDGKFHEVQVRIKNRPDLKARARAGYDAPRPSISEAESKESLEKAFGASVPTEGLTLRAFAAPIKPTAQGMRTAIVLEVSYPQAIDTGKVADNLEFGVVALDHEGKVKSSVRRTFRTSGTFVAGRGVTYLLNDVIDLPSEPLTLRLGISSEALDRVGVIHLPLEVINPRSSRVQLGSISLGFSGPSRQEAVPRDGLRNLIPFQPTATRIFSGQDTLQLFAPVFWSGDRPVSISLAVRRDGEIVLQRNDQIEGVPQDRNRSGFFFTTFALRGFPAGSYTLSLAATGMGGSNQRQLRFEVR